MAMQYNLVQRERDKFVEDLNGDTAVRTLVSSGLAPAKFDEITLGYTGSNLTAVAWKLNSATVKSITLAYTGSRLDSVSVD